MVLVDTEAVGLGVLETLERLEALGVGATHTGSHVRMVTHVDVSDDGVDVALEAWASVAGPRPPAPRGCEGGMMGLFTKNYPPEIAPASRRVSVS